jgi:hypothetical protein
MKVDEKKIDTVHTIFRLGLLAVSSARCGLEAWMN